MRSIFHFITTGSIRAGYLDKNDELHIVDRIDNVIIINSYKIYPSDVEKQIMCNTHQYGNI